MELNQVSNQSSSISFDTAKDKIISSFKNLSTLEKMTVISGIISAGLFVTDGLYNAFDYQVIHGMGGWTIKHAQRDLESYVVHGSEKFGLRENVLIGLLGLLDAAGGRAGLFGTASLALFLGNRITQQYQKEGGVRIIVIDDPSSGTRSVLE
jgi:hypothetical protein